MLGTPTALRTNTSIVANHPFASEIERKIVHVAHWDMEPVALVRQVGSMAALLVAAYISISNSCTFWSVDDPVLLEAALPGEGAICPGHTSFLHVIYVLHCMPVEDPTPSTHPVVDV